MKLTTKTIASLLVASVVSAAVPGVSQIASKKHHQKRPSQFDRLLATHDRKGEMRSAILGLNAHEFKQLSKKMTFEQIIKKCGFDTKRQFRIAMAGYLRNELVQRGWSRARIDRYVLARSVRFA
ncbi:MAG: hypothetical protein WAQ25_02340 [Candidatus Saccharimonas sp.]